MAVDNSHKRVQGGGEEIQSFAFVVGICICAVLCWWFSTEIWQSGRASEIELVSRINPNRASAASLVRLSGIGPSRAAAIVGYRENFRREGGDGRAFRDCNDLQKVKGIGPKTAENIREWLTFE